MKKVIKFHLTAIVLVVIIQTQFLIQAQKGREKLQEILAWKFIEFDISSGTPQNNLSVYNFSRVLPMDVDKSKDGRIFISLVGQDGVPARLGIVTNVPGPLGSGPLIKPYPNLSWFKYRDCDAITSVYRIAIDKCNRLWVLDTGRWEGDNNYTCLAQVIVFDLNTDKLLFRTKISPKISQNVDGQSLLTNPIVDARGPHCEDTVLYIADSIGMGLIVFDGKNFRRFWSQSFLADQNNVNVTVAGVTQRMPGGVAMLSLAPVKNPKTQHPYLFLRPLASRDLHFMDTSYFRQDTSNKPLPIHPHKNVLPSQSIGQTFSKTGTLFLGLTLETPIACYNIKSKLSAENIKIIVEDSERLQFVAGIKAYEDIQTRKEVLWIFSNKFPAFQQRRLDFTKVNFRVLAADPDVLVAGTPCQMSSNNNYNNFQGGRII